MHTARFVGVSVEQLVIPEVHGHVGDTLLGLVQSCVVGSRRTLVAHEEDQVSALQLADAVHISTLFLDPGALCPGVARQFDASCLQVNVADKVRAVKGRCCAAIRAEFIWRAEILLAFPNDLFHGCGSLSGRAACVS